MKCGGSARRHGVDCWIQVSLRSSEALVKQRRNPGHARSSGRRARKNGEGSSTAAIHAGSATSSKASEIAVVPRGGKRNVGRIAPGSCGGHAGSGLPTRSRDVTAHAAACAGNFRTRTRIERLIPGALGNVADHRLFAEAVVRVPVNGGIACVVKFRSAYAGGVA